jgi:aryl-alcohol dehydrogenase-like predicted oxidoreductase
MSFHLGESMKYNKLGNSGLLVSEIALGTMIFGEKTIRGTDQKTAIKIIHQFLDQGGNHIDTANVYVAGRSEEIVGKALQGKRDQAVLATKVRFKMGSGPNDQGLSRGHIIKSVEDSLRRLDVSYIDLLYMHCWDPLTPIEESLRAFDDLVSAGKVRYIGVSNFKAWQLMKSLSISQSNGWLQFTAAQYQYSLVERAIEAEISEICQNEGLGIVPWGPLGGGFLTGKYTRGDKPKKGRLSMMPEETEESWERRSQGKNWKIIDKMAAISEEQNLSFAQIALSWVLKQPQVCSVIIGARTLEQLEDNLRTSNLEIPEAELKELTEISQPVLGYPYRFIDLYGQR